MSKILSLRSFLTRRIRLALLVLLGLVCAYAVTGFFILPPVLRPWLEQEAGSALQRQVGIGKLEINPFLLRVVLRDVAIKEDDGLFFGFSALTADAELASIWRRGPVLREITLDTPSVRIVRLAADRYNFSDLLEGKSPEPAQPGRGLPRFSLNNIRIFNGKIEFDDRFLQSRQHVSELQLALPFVSTLPHRLDDYIEPGLSGRLNDAEFKLTAQSKPFLDSRETRLSLQLDRLNLPDYLAYLPLPKDVNLSSGQISGQVDVVFREDTEQPRLLIEGKLALADGRLDFRREPILVLPALQVDLQRLEPLAGQYHLARIGIDNPQVQVRRSGTGELNWLNAFATDKPAGKAASAPAAQAPLVEVAEFALDGGRIDFQDAAVKPAYAGRLEAIAIRAQRLSTAAGTSAPVGIAFSTGHGETFRTDLNVHVAPLAVSGRIAIKNLQPAHHAAYWAPYFAGEIRSGTLASALDFRFATAPQVIEVDKGELDLRDLAIALPKEKQPAIKLAALNASGISIDVGKRQLALASLAGAGLDSRLVMGRDGRINLLNLLPPAAAVSKPPANKARQADWRMRLGAVALENSALRLEDQRERQAPPLVLSNLMLKVNNLDSAQGSQASLDFSTRAGRRGQIRLSGPFVPQPFSARWQVDMRQFDAAFVQPYFADLLNIQLASIWLGARGALQVATQPKLAVRYRGNLAVNDLHAIDKVNGADFLKWRSLALTGVDVQSEPLKLALNDVALTDFYSRLILSSEGRLNLQDIVVREGQTASVTSSPAANAPAARPTEVASVPVKARAPLPPISIGKITLTGGNINYTDNFIQPNFTANLMDMGGVISGLSSTESARASLDLRGSVDRIAPVTVSGSLNPLAQQAFLDIKAAVKGYELTAASTYSAKYAGYGIEKGKLSMDVAYFIENSQLKAGNQLLLDQLTLGDRVESTDATKLPVKFALALLTDRHGQINLNLPIEGSLNDPQFRIGRIIWQVIGNLLEKAVTAPFRALGSLFGGDEATFSRVEFDPGQSVLTAGAKDALGKLAKALDDRPALKLDITGWVEPEADREGLKRAKLEEKIRARKLAQLADKGQSIDISALEIDAAERLKLLEQVYDREKFPKPRNAIGLQRRLPAEEMEKLILANTTVSDDDLLNLAMRRATVAKDALTAAGVDEARLFILKPKLNAGADAADKDDGKPARAQFMLK